MPRITRLKARLRSLRRDSRGNVLMILALGTPLLIGAVGLAVDTAQWTLAKRQLQSAADDAAKSGVFAVIKNASVDDAVAATVGERHAPAETNIQINRTPAGRLDDPFAVEVRLTAPAATTFAGMFMASRPIVTATALATVVEDGQYCAFAVGDGDDNGIKLEEDTSVDSQCGIATNSSSKDAVQTVGSSSITAPRVAAYGGIDGSKSPDTFVARSYGLRQKDPLADTDAPLVPNTGCPNVTINADSASTQGTVALKPGCYGNMLINGPIVLLPGEFILNRGNMIVGPTGSVICNGCTIFLTSQDAATDPGSIGKVRMDPHANIKLAAPTQGPNAGLLIYQDRHAGREVAGEENRIGGNSLSKISGLIYLPSQGLRLDGESNPDLSCARVIGRRLIIKGRLFIAKDCEGSKPTTFAGTDVRLIQ